MCDNWGRSPLSPEPHSPSEPAPRVLTSPSEGTAGEGKKPGTSVFELEGPLLKRNSGERGLGKVRGRTSVQSSVKGRVWGRVLPTPTGNRLDDDDKPKDISRPGYSSRLRPGYVINGHVVRSGSTTVVHPWSFCSSDLLIHPPVEESGSPRTNERRPDF